MEGEMSYRDEPEKLFEDVQGDIGTRCNGEWDDSFNLETLYQAFKLRMMRELQADVLTLRLFNREVLSQDSDG
jgi:hypothetical protein